MILIDIPIYTYLAGCIVYNFVLSVAGRFTPRRQPAVQDPARYNRIAILVPAYKEDGVILSTATSYTGLNYPKSHYDVIVIADSLQPETLSALRETNTKVIPVVFDKSTKARSLNEAFRQLPDEYDIAVIADADNVVETDFLLKVNSAYLNGAQAIQTQRVAKNLDTPFAILDTANEIIGNHLYRKGANAIGLSSSVIGSGMAFHFPLIKTVMQEIQAIGGFDKVLQLRLIAHGQKIVYLEDALIFDEKVENSGDFSNQRRRWLSSQIVYLRKFWSEGWRQLFKGNVDYFNMAVCQNLMMPRMLLMASMILFTLIALVLPSSLVTIPFSWWAVLFALNCISLLLPIPAVFFRKYMLRALISLPKAMFIMVMLLFRMKGANKTFIHTRHTKTGINNPLLDAARK
ncbi:glycosyltransferase [Chitinophaga cymbidii]|uniref:Glycosyl transferase n=1 Tax=Chitinophaga cymbidii TaxID=1096750 RepID=A0A512RRP1_9BACT|nr:glycosyltransferase family 2 protein [Chitinophaga cymbidii]GEP98363.1 glycosyl transferase [Chitinophaga cymbidii]